MENKNIVTDHKCDRNGNKYWLSGMACPRCGQHEIFKINLNLEQLHVVTDSYVYSVGLASHIKGYNEESFCKCPECGKEGKAQDFIFSQAAFRQDWDGEEEEEKEEDTDD